MKVAAWEKLFCLLARVAGAWGAAIGDWPFSFVRTRIGRIRHSQSVQQVRKVFDPPGNEMLYRAFALQLACHSEQATRDDGPAKSLIGLWPYNDVGNSRFIFQRQKDNT